jgi:hypothetical protein
MPAKVFEAAMGGGSGKARVWGTKYGLLMKLPVGNCDDN